MARIKLGSFSESTIETIKTPEQKAELAYQDTVRMLELNKKIEEMGFSLKLTNEKISKLEDRKPQIIKENFHTETVIEKELPQVIKEVYHTDIIKTDKVDFSEINKSIDNVLNQSNASYDELDNRLNDIIEGNISQFDEIMQMNFGLHKTIEVISNKTFDLNKKLKVQKIINILLALGLVISLFK